MWCTWACLCLCMYVCMCVFMCTCVYMCGVCICMCVPTCIDIEYVRNFHKDTMSPTHPQVTETNTEKSSLCNQLRLTFFSWDCRTSRKGLSLHYWALRVELAPKKGQGGQKLVGPTASSRTATIRGATGSVIKRLRRFMDSSLYRLHLHTALLPAPRMATSPSVGISMHSPLGIHR